MAGFQAEQIDAAREQGKLRVDPETLSNHLGRISQAAVERGWWTTCGCCGPNAGIGAESTRWMERPSHTLREVGHYKGAEQVGDACGYKLVVVLNIEEGHERVVAWVLGGLARSEKTMLRYLLRKLREQFGRLGDWMKVLVMDRGYWGADCCWT